MWVKELQTTLTNEIPIIIAGNKCDLKNPAINKESLDKYVR